MRRIITLLFVLFALPSQCFSDENVYKAVVGPDGVEHVEITAGSYFFKPVHIVVKVNVPVELTLRSESSIIPHNFVLNAPEAGMDVSVSLSREPKTVQVTPTKAGTYDFYCDRRFLFFRSHRARGMEGKLEVVD
ncbi:MAG: cupredoxin domain-containing protein [Deltaproteobacteria bacterium]|nr:cupredoxin domain-containing protein [Deltaproteobacteria bacterium]